MSVKSGVITKKSKFLNYSSRHVAKRRPSSVKLMGVVGRGGRGDFSKIFINWLCTKLKQHLNEGARIFLHVCTERVGGYDPKRIHAHKGDGLIKE